MFSSDMYIALAFIVGFIVGGLFCFFGIPKLFPNHRMQDELTRTKRELYSARRALDEFFKNSEDLFSVLDKHYHNYAEYMHNAAARLSNAADSFLIMEDSEQTVSDDSHEQTEIADEKPQETQDVTSSVQPVEDTAGDTDVSEEKKTEPPLEEELVKPQVYNNDLPDLAEPSTFELNDREHHVDIRAGTEDISMTKDNKNNDII